MEKRGKLSAAGSTRDMKMGGKRFRGGSLDPTPLADLSCNILEKVLLRVEGRKRRLDPAKFNILEDVLQRGRVARLDPAIWADLPSDVLEEVLLRLPLDSLGKFRGVCRDWNKMLRSTSFAEERATIRGSDGSWILTFEDQERHQDILGSVYQSSRNVWRTAWLSDMRRCSWHNQGLTSDGGLVCFNNFVVNLVTGSWRELECGLPDDSMKLSAFKVDTATNVYRVFFLAKEGAKRRQRKFMKFTKRSDNYQLTYDYLMIYDSEQNSWRKTKNSPADFNITGPGVVVDDCVYFISYGSEIDPALTMIYYNLKEDTWGSCVLRHYWSLAQWKRTLHHWQGEMYVIAMSERWNAVHVDKVDFENSQCSIVSSMWRTDFKEVVGSECTNIDVHNVTSCGDLIVVLISYTIEMQRMQDLAFYNLGTNNWSSTKEPHHIGELNHMVVAVEPRLNIGA